MPMSEIAKIKTNPRKLLFLDWTLDLLIYIVVLNLFMEYSSGIYIETFTLSILVALVLKILLHSVIKLEGFRKET